MILNNGKKNAAIRLIKIVSTENIFVRRSLPLILIALFPFQCANFVRGDDKAHIDFCAYRANSTMNGSLYLYLKNDGKEAVGVKDVTISGLPMKKLIEDETVAWHRMRPESVPAGEMGELLIRFKCIPLKILEELFFSKNARVDLDVGLALTNGQTLTARVPISEKKEPLQINFIAFSKDLKKIYVYLQNNLEQQTFSLSKIFVNGHDYTDKAVFGQRKLSGTVVPVEILLDKPLAEGTPAVVAVHTKEGVKTGHTLRALPSEFPIQVCFYAPILRYDAVRDIYNHGFTCLSTTKDNWLEDAKKMNLSAFHYGAANALKILEHFDCEKYPKVSGMWLDEMDDHPIQVTIELFDQLEDYYKKAEKTMPLHTINLCGATTPRGTDFLELGDAVTHEYGLDGLGRSGGEFASCGSLPQREYRLARRPFIPYLRNIETGLEVDDASDKIIGLSTKRAYIIEPREERWMTYGCLMQGAKGIMHWGYGACKRKAPNWFSQKHPVIRIGMGGLPGNMAYGYKIPDHIVNDLRATWDEVGRINAELQTIGDKVAISDVSDLAQITSSVPEINQKSGKKAAEVGTLLCGNDTVIILLLNMNMDTKWSPRRKYGEGIKSYDPVDVTVDFAVPSWLDTKDIFTVSCKGISTINAPQKEGKIKFHFPRLEVSEIIVLTSDKNLRADMAEKLSDMQKRLAKISTDKPAPIKDRCEKVEHTMKHVKADKKEGVVYLSDLKPLSSRQGWGELQFDKSVDKNPLTIVDTVFGKGLGTHAESEIIYQLGGKYERLEGFAGIDWEAFPTGNATFEIYLDGKKAFNSGLLSVTSPPERVSLDVSGVNELKLTVGTGGNLDGSKHADWADMKLLDNKASCELISGGKGQTWKLSDKKAVDVRGEKQAGTHYCLSSYKLQNGTMEATVVPIEKHAINGIGGYGFIKYIDPENFIAFRFGAYGTNNVFILQNGKRILQTGHAFKPEPGNEYRLKIVLQNDRAVFYINGKESGRVSDLPFQDKEGIAGVCSIGLAEFKDWSFSKSGK